MVAPNRALSRLLACTLLMTTIAAGLAAAASPLSPHEDEFALSPSGTRIHRDCFHSVAELASASGGAAPLARIESDAVAGDRLVFADGTQKLLPPCAHAPLPRSGRLLQTPPPPPPQDRGSDEASRLNTTYYSNWVAYAGYTHPTDDLTTFTSTWTVPDAPPSPGLLTTVFYFNGVEQQLHNTSAIYQPVLQFGYSGCGGAFAWTMTAFVVTDAGRAYCGQMLSVKPGDVVRGNMTRTASVAGSGGGDPWTITAEVLSQPQLPVSHISAVSPVPMRFACLVLEAIRMYACNEYPASSPLVFRQNHLGLAGGTELLHPPWNITINHNECAQSVTIGAGPTPDVAISVTAAAASEL